MTALTERRDGEDVAERLASALRYLSMEAFRNGYSGTSLLIETAVQSLSEDPANDRPNQQQ